jgi:hypothetical protein
MSRGATYFGLLAALKHEDMIYDARRRQRSTDVIRRRRGRSLGATLLQVLRVRR